MMETVYLEAVQLVERTHRAFLDMLKRELDSQQIHDINNVQATTLFNIGEAEMTAAELIYRGCYLGSNVSYNLKKMVENGYIEQRRSKHDARSNRVRLSAKGLQLRERLNAVHRRYTNMLPDIGVTDHDLGKAIASLRSLERVWAEGGRVDGEPPGFVGRPAAVAGNRR